MKFIILSETEGNRNPFNDEFIEKLLKGQIIWIIIGAVVALIVLICLLRKFYKVPRGKKAIILRKKVLFKVLDGDKKEERTHFIIPFVESLGGEFVLENNEICFDNIQINDGPDKLYKISATLVYDILDLPLFYNSRKTNFNDDISKIVNESLRKYVYEGHGNVLLKTYREDEQKIVNLLNEEMTKIGLSIKSFKVDTIQPMGVNS